MLEKIKKSIRHELLKVKWIQREVDAYRFEQLQQIRREKKQAHRELWAKHLSSGNTIRNAESDKPMEFSRFDSLQWGIGE